LYKGTTGKSIELNYMTNKNRRIRNLSGKAQCDLCGTKTVLVIHHILGRNIPNCNHMSNLANLCPNDHALVHTGKIFIEKWVSTTSGRVLSWHTKDEPGLVGVDSVPYQIGGS